MICTTCNQPLSRNHFLRKGVRSCSRCAVGSGWQMVRVEGLQVPQHDPAVEVIMREHHLELARMSRRRYRAKKKLEKVNSAAPTKQSRRRPDHSALISKMLD